MDEKPQSQNPSPSVCDQPWCTWGVLIILSLAMAATGLFHMPRKISVPFLVAVMGVMSWLIASRFMHLREEKKMLTVTVVGSTIFVIVFLFVLTAWDAISILHLSTP